MSAPSEAELFALAERALAHAGEEAQVTAWWERWVSAGVRGGTSLEHVGVEVACVRGGSVACIETQDVSDEGLRGAAEGAFRVAGRSGEGRYAGLPEPAPGRPHDGWDPRVAALEPADLAVDLRPGITRGGGASRVAIVSTRGVHAFEQRRTHAWRQVAPSWRRSRPTALLTPRPWAPAGPTTSAGRRVSSPASTRSSSVLLPLPRRSKRSGASPTGADTVWPRRTSTSPTHPDSRARFPAPTTRRGCRGNHPR